MKYDFDKIINRNGTYSIKYNPAARGIPEDVLPMWVADMDFRSPPCVAEALNKQAEHGIFGYSEPDGAYFDVLKKWFEKRFDWHIKNEWLTVTPGVVNAIFIAIRALTAPGDGVVIQQPVYYPFMSGILKNGRRLLVNQLLYDNDKYSVDFDDFERKVKAAKLFILCNPHNPVGRVWTKDELNSMGEICLKHGVTVIADEIHQDFVYSGYKHIVFSALNNKLSEITMTCTSPSKTFNLAGLLHANIFIPNKALRDKFKMEYSNCGLSQPGIMGLAACKAAYEHGGEWLSELLVYLSGNISFTDEFLKTHIPGIKLVKPEGTYLAWLDCTEISHSSKELDEIITHKAKLWLDGGTMFGAGGEGFQRINIACPQSVVNDALSRLKNIF